MKKIRNFKNFALPKINESTIDVDKFEKEKINEMIKFLESKSEKFKGFTISEISTKVDSVSFDSIDGNDNSNDRGFKLIYKYSYETGPTRINDRMDNLIFDYSEKENLDKYKNYKFYKEFVNDDKPLEELAQIKNICKSGLIDDFINQLQKIHDEILRDNIGKSTGIL